MGSRLYRSLQTSAVTFLALSLTLLSALLRPTTATSAPFAMSDDDHQGSPQEDVDASATINIKVGSLSPLAFFSLWFSLFDGALTIADVRGFSRW